MNAPVNAGLTPMEAESLEMWLLVQERLNRRKVGQWEYMELMGFIRDIIQKLESKKLGCPMGVHFQTCKCTETQRTFTSKRR